MSDIEIPFHKSELLEHEKKNLQSYLIDIMNTDMFTNGKYLERLETKIAKISNRKYAVAFSSGTAALYCAIKALRLEGVILTSPHTWIATVNAIEVAGCYSRYYDVDENGLMDVPEPPPGFTSKDIKETYGGMLPVSLYGQGMNYGVYKSYTVLPLILDACHSINQIDHLDEDKIFDIMCFSLHPTKLFFAGEGGFALTDWEDQYDMLKRFRYQGLDDNKFRREVSIKFSLPEMSAACALTTMESFDKRVSLQRKKMRKYLETFDLFPELNDKVRVISTIDCTMMTIEVLNGYRDELQQYIKEAGYQTDVKYPDILYTMNMVARDSYPRTKEMTRNILTYPCYPTLDEKHIEDMVKKTAMFFRMSQQF